MTTSPNPNHAEKAETILSALDGTDQRAATVQAVSALAQVHATLALVEEQRTANLIALWGALRNPPAGMRPTTEQWERIVRLDDLIAARLDLTQDVTP